VNLKNCENGPMNSKVLNHNIYLATLTSDDIDETCDNIIEIVNNVFNEVAPIKKIKINNSNSTYNKVTKEAINERNEAYKTMKANNTVENKLNFKNIKYKTKKIIMNENIKTEIKHFENNNGNNYKIWKKAKEKLFKTEENQLDRVIDNNVLVIGSKRTCESINNFFINKVKNLNDNLKPQIEDPMIQYNKSIKTPIKLLKFKQISMDKIKRIFSKLKKSNSASHYNISGKMLNIIKESIIPLLLNLVNNSFKQNKFPEATKTHQTHIYTNLFTPTQTYTNLLTPT
jgi:hypothetical protein